VNHTENVARSWVEEVEAAAVDCHRLARQYWENFGGVGIMENSEKVLASHDATRLLESFGRDEFYFSLPFVERYRAARQYLEAAWLASYYSARLQGWATSKIEEAAN